MIGSIYGHASDSDDRSRLFSETLEFLNSSGLPWILLGDYNATEEDQEISPFLASGKAFSLDEDFAAEGLPIATRKDGKRRLDFGLSSRDYYATQRWQQAGLSDHDLVGYEIPIATPVDLCYLPSRRRFSSTDAQTLAFFQEHWSSLRFSETFQQQSLDQGWTMLSNFAEDALAGDNSSTGTRRSAGWTPKPKAAYHKAAKSQEPLLLRQLRRVHRRLVELIRRPHQDDLKRVLRKNIQMLQVKIPQLIGNTNANAEELATILQDAIAEKERHCIQEHRTAWKTSLQDSSIKQSQWIRRRASAVRTEVALADAESRHLWLAKATAICPQHQIQEAEQQWTEIWTKRPITDVRWNVQTALLNSVQAPSTTMPIPILTGKDLLSSCKHMQDKAAGPGGWEAKDLIRLPQPWWDALALIWNRVLQEGHVPQRWAEARIAVIPKRTTGTRPLSVISILWRCGARVLARKLRPWALQWADHRTLGGLPGRGVLDAHIRIAAALEEDVEDQIFVSQDLTKFFDTIDLDQAAAVLRHLRAPPAIIALIQGFYRQNRRIFSSKGIIGRCWQVCGRGLMQGCPFSPLIASAIMKVWCDFVFVDQNLDGCVYLDDRTFWTKANAANDAVQVAKQRSDTFDACFNLECQISKCSVAARDPGLVHRFSPNDLGYGETSTDLKVLGLEYHLDQSNPVELAQYDVALASKRLQLIRWAVSARYARCALIAKLITPLFNWASGLAKLDEAKLHELRQSVLWVFGPHFAQDFPACIALELLGWKQDPQFATVWASLQRAIRYHSHPPVWLHHCGRDFASKTWQQVLPQAAGAVEQCGWNISADGSTIQRLDSHGQHRSFQLGVDNPVILFEWLRNVFRTNELKKSKRVQRSLHRQGEGAERCARGQLLPGPPPGLCLFQGHNYLFRNDHDRSIQHACLATGASFWFFNVGARLAADHPRRKCICGGSTPSRPHLVWECPATLHLRAQIGRPSHRAEERLFAKVCLEMPAPPPEDNGDIMENFIQTLTTCMDESSTPLPLATDGSTTRSQVAAWGVYLPTADQHFTGGIAGEDQSPFRAEVVAIVQTLQGLIHACRARPHLARKKHVILISDCQSALALCNDCIGSTPLLARQVQQLIRQLQSAVAKLEFLWIPSHGKLVKDTLFTSVFTEAELRKWNDVIDKAVRSKASEKAAGSNREAWWNQACVDKDWEMKVIRTVAAAHVRYQSYLMSL